MKKPSPLLTNALTLFRRRRRPGGQTALANAATMQNPAKSLTAWAPSWGATVAIGAAVAIVSIGGTVLVIKKTKFGSSIAASAPRSNPRRRRRHGKKS